MTNTQAIFVAPTLIAAGLVVAAGAVKIRRPRALSLVLTSARLPAGVGLVRTLGGIEIVVGVSVLLAAPEAAVLALAGLYVGFSVFLVGVRIAGLPVTSCGCLGETESPPSTLHAVLTGLASAAALCALYSGPVSLPEVFDELGVVESAAWLFGAGAVGYSAYLTAAYFTPLALSYSPPLATVVATTEGRNDVD